MYETFTPLDTWTTRPRVMTYTRKGTGLKTTQLRPCSSRDLLFLQIQRSNGPTLTITNIYNAPQGGTDAGEAVDLLMELPTSLWRSTLIAEIGRAHV